MKSLITLLSLAAFILICFLILIFFIPKKEDIYNVPFDPVYYTYNKIQKIGGKEIIIFKDKTPEIIVGIQGMNELQFNKLIVLKKEFESKYNLIILIVSKLKVYTNSVELLDLKMKYEL